MLSLDLVFWSNKLALWVRRTVGMTPGLAFEDELERSMRGFAKSNFGMDPGPAAFEG